VASLDKADTRYQSISSSKKAYQKQAESTENLLCSQRTHQKQEEELERVRTEKEELEQQLVTDERGTKQIHLNGMVGRSEESVS
jgi:hypothetical protein